MSPTIPISAVSLDEHAEGLVLEVVRSGHLVQGPMVERLEAAFSEACDVPHAIAVNSGTTALVAALQALGIGPGDEVVTSPFTFVATINAVLEAGATARFADIDPITFTTTPEGIRKHLSERTRAVMPVHLYGHPADMKGIESAIHSGDGGRRGRGPGARRHRGGSTCRIIRARLLLVVRDEERHDRRGRNDHHGRRSFG